ncbi:MAG TPA: glycoside hydrolase family 38 C-terminal domain-containing protein [Gaiellaceae bacterium]|nr:glycoside hydrolase family 38 C-terminal domain-containing protein [Gaiellaceae bacterium]
MIRHPQYTRERLARTAQRLRAAIHPERVQPDVLLVAGPVDRIPYEEAQQLDYRPAELGERLGPLWATYWFRVGATVPDGWDGRRVDLLWESRAESTLWQDGRAVQGLHGTEPHQRPDATVAWPAKAGERVELEVELACNGLFGRLDRPPEVERCELALVDEAAWKLYFDFEVLRVLEASETLEPGFGGHLREELNRFCNEGDPAILDALYEHRNGTRVHRISAIGHAHIDTAWLWPLAETKRKLVRTFASQTRYLDEYPEYRFACSQAQQYAYVEESDPDLWRRIRAKVDAGQWIPVGGSWVEPDCNVPSGESLLRQFVHGQRYFEDRFGIRCREFWSPDAFGYCGQLPQLMRLAGIDRFLTQKLSWNRFNRPDSHTFVWQGIDGSEVLGHFPPADTYNSDVSVDEVLKTAREFKDHESSERSLLVFGFGDGGGGPTRAMLENLGRMRDLQGLPRVEPSTSDAFFSALEAEGSERPTVVGELYFEYHRGVYTSQAFVKRGNRVCEQLLHDAELLGAVRGDAASAELDRLWKLLLLQQFHDILPGSSIGLVYDDARRDFAELESSLHALIGEGDALVNTVGVHRREVIDGRLVEAAPYADARDVEADDEVRVDGLVLQNAHLRVELGEDGSVLSVVDRASGRETLAAPGNVLETYEDRPVEFDAWDIDPSHLETRRPCPPADAWEVVADGPLRAEIAFDRHVGESSTLRQVVRLDAGARRVEFRTTVDWHEEHVLLKTCFPLEVHAPTATYEAPFGYAERPTHYSTSFDRAKYEVPGHRFADLSEHGFGAALLTDSKYGYSCFGNELRVSLLRSPKSPDPNADMGGHEFAYALYPHAGGWREGGVLAEAIRFNAPLRLTRPVGGSFASVDTPDLVLDTIKRADSGEGLVLRLYEAHGGRGTARVRLREPFGQARLANALEEPFAAVEVEGDELVLPFRPHQVLTVLVEQ